ncbi:MAG TPA: putative 2-aminoethylphosphonate ABC transporter permease subunit, partial [Aggregatilineaceae bacterium]|nr:putative 2-aminoethylphosphonate ABC transporter permease subunit [Aggregatilineaceae bacterium]
SLLQGIAFIYLFGNKGIITRGVLPLPGYNLLTGQHLGRILHLPFSFNIDLYNGPNGIILAEVFYLFPHALLILMVSLAIADARLYEASNALGASSLRTFFSVTLPGVKYGLISTAFVCFTLVITDFGIPKVITDRYIVMATQIYQQVIGQQRFDRGATVAILLMLPTVLGFTIDRLAQRRQFALIRSGSVPYIPNRNVWMDGAAFVFCAVITLLIVLVIATAAYASLVRVWPYDFTLGWRNYQFSRYAGGYSSGGSLATYWNSVRMASFTALAGPLIVFVTAYLIEKGKGLQRVRALMYFFATLPVALPGLVLGLAYIFYFNSRHNPLNVIYGTMTILVVSTIVHFFTVSFFTATTALKQIDMEFEAVGESLSVPFYVTFFRVTLPVALPAILEIAVYYFVNAMTTVSAVIFLYSAHLKLAAISAVNMDDAGDTAPAAAMSMLIFFTGIGVRIAYEMAAYGLRRYTQAWREK